MLHETDTSIGGLVRGAMTDVRELLREEIALARAELRQEATKASAAAVQFTVAGVALLMAVACISIALALGISALLDWPAWAGFAIVAVLLSIGGAAMVAGGRRAIGNVQTLPRTMQTLKENFR